MFDKILTHVHSRAQKEIDQHFMQARQTVRASMQTLQSVGEILLDESVSDTELRKRVFTLISKETLAEVLEGIEQWVSGKKSHVFDAVMKRFSYLRKFTPVFFKALDFFEESADRRNPSLHALGLLKKLNADNKRQLPQKVPLDFVPERLMPLVQPEGKPVDKRAWECALLVQLRDEIKAGNVSRSRTVNALAVSRISSLMRTSGRVFERAFSKERNSRKIQRALPITSPSGWAKPMLFS